MTGKLPTKPKDEMALMRLIWSPEVADDPLAFAKVVFPWGTKGTPLEPFLGPRKWQAEDFAEIRQHIVDNQNKMALGLFPEVFRKATAAGRGPGKSARLAMLIYWFMSTRIGGTCIVTANNEGQLKTKTWAELGKWHTLAINSHWFDRQALSLRPAPWFDEAIKKQLKIDTGYYYASAQLWSEENPDAFAGAHNPLGIMVVFDEASGIPTPIWTVTEGFFTEPVLHRYWLADGNPRRNTGAFFECFHKNRDIWRHRNIDSRTVEGTDTAVLESIVKQFGADSDEARIEVYGQFPHHGDKQFISRRVIEDATTRELQADDWAPLVMGVDVARFGDDSSVIYLRRGRDARSIAPLKFKGLDNMQMAYRVAEAIDKYKPDAVCIDAGNGTGVIDRLKELKYKIVEVWFGSKPNEPEWANKRTEMWARMREWLGGGCIPALTPLMDDLAGPEYKYRGQSDVIMLEPKEEMKRRGLASPDYGDALACTFAVKVARLDMKARRAGGNRVAADVDYPLHS